MANRPWDDLPLVERSAPILRPDGTWYTIPLCVHSFEPLPLMPEPCAHDH